MIDYPLAISSWEMEELDAISEVLKSGNFTMGSKVSLFEKEFANYCGTNFAVMFNSGSSANLALLQALKYSNNVSDNSDLEIIVPTISWSTTFYPVNQAGFKLKFVDIDLETLNIDVELIEKAINKNTFAIFAVNLLGNPCELDELEKIAKKYSLILIEDNCESLGSEISGRKAGTFGMAGTYSFFFSHHICTMEGGMVTTNSERLTHFLKSIRAHGWTRGLPADNYVHPLTGNPWQDQFRFVLPGYNLRPLEIEAAAGSVQLQKFPSFLAKRRKNGQVFKEVFGSKTDLLIQKEFGNSSWFGFSITLTNRLKGKREDVIRILEENGVESRPVVAGNFLRNPVMKYLKYSIHGTTPNADYINENGLFIGNHHIDLSDKIRQLGELEFLGKRK